MGPELSRRWLAVLLSIPASEREEAVRVIEASVAKAYSGGQATSVTAARTRGKRGKGKHAGTSVDVVRPPVQRDGYTEQIVTTYEVRESEGTPAQRKRRSAGA